jgi:hypothetical protein
MSAESTANVRNPETFRKYLESSGVNDLLSKAIAQLYERHEANNDPADPVDYIQKLVSFNESKLSMSFFGAFLFFSFLLFFFFLFFFP